MAEQKYCKKCGTVLDNSGRCSNCDGVADQKSYVENIGNKSNAGISSKIKGVGIGLIVIIIAIVAVKMFVLSDVQAEEISGSWAGVLTYDTVKLEIAPTGNPETDEQIDAMKEELQKKQGTKESAIRWNIDIDSEGKGTIDLGGLVGYGTEDFAVTYSNGKLKLSDKKKLGNVGEEYVIDADGSFKVKRDEYKDLRMNGTLTLDTSGFVGKDKDGNDITGKATLAFSGEFKKDK